MNIEDTWKPIPKPENMRLKLIYQVRIILSKEIKNLRKVKRELKRPVSYVEFVDLKEGELLKSSPMR